MTTKIAVSLPDEQVEAARTAVAEGRAPSVSAYVSEALARRSAEDELLQLLDDDETQEPATDEHQAWARRALRGADPETAQRPAPHRSRATGAPRRRSEGARARELGSAGPEGPRRQARRGAAGGTTGSPESDLNHEVTGEPGSARRKDRGPRGRRSTSDGLQET